MSQWKLLRGIHHDKNAVPIRLVEVEGIDRSLEDWENLAKDKAPPSLYPGDIFESDQDLNKFNIPGSPQRYEKLEGVHDELDSLTVTKLQDMAQSEGIEVPKGLRKDLLVSAIRSHLKYQEAITSV